MEAKIYSPFRVFLISVLMVIVPTSQVTAAMISTERVVADMSQERAKLAAFIGRDEVKAKLVEWGVSPQEAAQRVASLSDAEIQRAVSRIDTLPVGGDGVSIGLGALILIVILVVLLLR